MHLFTSAPDPIVFLGRWSICTIESGNKNLSFVFGDVIIHNEAQAQREQECEEQGCFKTFYVTERPSVANIDFISL